MRKSILSWLVCLGAVSLAGSAGVRAAETGRDALETNITRLLGEWREYWGTPGQTDVTYHDQYRISRRGDTTVKVTTINRDQLVEDERAENGTLTFTQHTDAYLVRYSLALQPDNNWLIGTATTPRGVYPIKWERTSAGAAETGPSASDATLVSFLGEWSEQWGTPGQTDVTYHDQYRISRKDATTAKVTTINRDQLVEDERVEHGTLTFTQHTDAYLVRYSLTLQPDKNLLVGTATTPKGVFDVKWSRTSSGAAEAGTAAPGSAITRMLGEWREYWGTPGQTDVTYHDQYRIGRNEDTAVKVTTINRNQLVEDERVENETLTFTQHTDAYLVRYSLTLQPDNNWLIGTATTPRGVYPIKWERTK